MSYLRKIARLASCRNIVKKMIAFGREGSERNSMAEIHVFVRQINQLSFAKHFKTVTGSRSS